MLPVFIDSSCGRLFGVYWPAANDCNKVVLHIPAFAEEMNKSRHMVALQAKVLNELGYAVLIIDLFGTGDSAGDFSEATWAIWHQNISDALAWLQGLHLQSVMLWGLRAGALLAMDFASKNPGQVERILAWQPVLNGDLFVTQFLRLRVAAAMMNSALPQEKTSDLKKQIKDNQALEVAGYLLNPELINPLMTIKLDPMSLKQLRDVTILEVISGENAQPVFANQQLFDELESIGIESNYVKVVGESFWNSQEIVTAPELLDATQESLRNWQ
ncbi:hydrolase 2, exosortase A system-associated [Methylomonas methanica]|uniref:Hydrolase, exosortase system type 1 associated n=1 Tax=Methylomonas methanica (strain DSM 25384 / MC09) TaxID=857087 RepID=F9ZWH3_METMM|nr:hydrolase 2, exosortase A system-associated [Methylomonas methanica]AEF99642.1 hydrolase, exosortase system type 1 associated [Methylomonas methanica MC09]